MSRVTLTRAFHARLKALGYKYLMITDVKIVCPKNSFFNITLRPGKSIPACQLYSCTSIDDVMITATLENAAAQWCDIYIEEAAD